MPVMKYKVAIKNDDEGYHYVNYRAKGYRRMLIQFLNEYKDRGCKVDHVVVFSSSKNKWVRCTPIGI